MAAPFGEIGRRQRYEERSPARCFSTWNAQNSIASRSLLQQHDLPHDPARFSKDALGVQQALETLLGAGPVSAFGEDLFRIDEDRGSWKVLQPVQEHGSGDLCDMLAWDPTRPDRWRFLTGAGQLLGSLWLDVGEPELRVYATPLSWLRADGHGVCLLRRERMVVLRHLTLPRTLILDDLALADWLDRVLRDPGPVPHILVEVDPEAVR